jgi:excisionase family DNA binding protein
MAKRKRAAVKPNGLKGRFLTITETCAKVGRTRATVRRLIRARKLVAALVGNEVRVSEASLQEYLRPRSMYRRGLRQSVRVGMTSCEPS